VGSFEHRIVEPLAPKPGELVLNKVTSSAFLSTGLDQILRNMAITDLVVTGLLTNGCVEATAIGAADRGFRVTLVEDACGTFSLEAHEASLRNFARMRGLVADTEQMVRLMSQQLEPSTP
jgi:nicotinamidase-related amidase